MRSTRLAASEAGAADRRICAYIRCSSEQTENGHNSLDSQKSEILSYAKKNNLQIVRFYSDAALSGSQVDNRPSLLRCLEDSKAQQFHRVVVTKLDRIARNTFYTLWIEKELKRSGVELFSIAEPYRWEDASQKIFLTIISAFAEFERKRISDRLYSGRRQKFLLGKFSGGGVNYGFVTKQGELAIYEEEAQTVRRIFKMRMGRHSFQKIADVLNSENVRTKRHGRWYGSTIRAICKSRIYSGYVKCGGELMKGVHPIIR